MKRTVFGVLVMSSLVGVGSVGVYYAQGKLAPQATAAATDSTPVDRVHEPQPIPVGRQVPPAAVAQDPYGESSSQQVVAVEDRYSADDGPRPAPAAAPIPADEIPDADQAVSDRYASYEAVPAAATTPADEIPPADQVAAAPSASPFSAGIPDSAAASPRYAEQPAAAEEPAAEPANPAPNDSIAGAPRRLNAAAPPVQDE